MESEESPIFTSEHAGIFISSAALVGATENTHLRLVLIRDLDPQYGPGSSSEPVAHFSLGTTQWVGDDNIQQLKSSIGIHYICRAICAQGAKG